MRSRNVFIVTILTVMILFSGLIFLNRWSPDTTHLNKSIPAKVTRGTPVARTSTPNLSDGLMSNLVYIARIVSADQEIIVYAIVGIFGMLMMVFVITTLSSHDKNKTDAMLELLREEKEKAEHLAELKSQFLNQVSHELRTPLAVIIGYLECLTDGLYGKIDGKHQEILEVVAKQSGHLKNMIDQILIFSRLEANRVSLRIQEFSPSKTLAELRESFDFLCAQKGLDLRWELSRTTPLMKSDPDRFKEIASNLLQNAVKYTDRGSITVRLDTLPTDSIVLEVADTGMGIPATAIKTIFEPFIQVHKTSSTNSRGGIGLGLSIVKKHTEQLNGTISVLSDTGKGSTFRVILPRVYKVKESGFKRILRALRFASNGAGTAMKGVPETTQLQTASRIREESTPL